MFRSSEKVPERKRKNLSNFTQHCIRNIIRRTTSLALKIDRYLGCATGNGLVVKATHLQVGPPPPLSLEKQKWQKTQKITNDHLRQSINLNKLC